MNILRTMNWLRGSEDVTTRVFEHFCNGTVFMDADKFNFICVPRFREIFNASADHAEMLKNCGDSELVALADQFSAEKSARLACAAMEKVLQDSFK